MNAIPETRQQKHAAAYLQQLWDIFGAEPKTVPAMLTEPFRQLFIYNPQTKQPETMIVTVPFQVTVTLMTERRAYTFFTDQNDDPFDFARQMQKDGLSLELWADKMLRACGVGEVDECMTWNWEAYSEAVEAEAASWQPANEENFSDVVEVEQAKKAAQKLVACCPSLFDTMRINQDWPHGDFEISELVDPYDFIEWDTAFIRAVFLIHRAAKMSLQQPG